jgi:hypothetical protein
MPRTSRAAQELGNLRVGAPTLVCPQELPKKSRARAIFEDIAAVSDHLEPSDIPLLVAYCRALALAERAAKDMAKAHGTELRALTDMHTRTLRSAGHLAAALKLSPRGRNHNFRSRSGKTAGPKPWEDGGAPEPAGDNVRSFADVKSRQ